MSNVMSLSLAAEIYKRSFCPLLKAAGFSKSNSTWRKEQGESVAVLNLQKSRWGDGAFYLNIGVYFYALGSEVSPTENRCHVQLRLEPLPEPAEAVRQVTEWFKARSSLRQASVLAESDSKKGLVFKEVRIEPAT
jgi:hypothetical protein